MPMLQEGSALTAGGVCEAGCQIQLLPSISGQIEYRLSMKATPSHANAITLAISIHFSNYHYLNHHLQEMLDGEALAQLP